MGFHSFVFPILRYHDRWEELGEEDFDSGYFDSLKMHKGYKLVTEKVIEKVPDIRYAPLKMECRDDIEEMDSLLTEYADGIVGLCQEKNIKLIFVRTPYLGASEDEYLQIKKYALHNNVDYYDLNQEELYRKMNYDIRNDNVDLSHANIDGAAKISSFIGEMILIYLNGIGRDFHL